MICFFLRKPTKLCGFYFSELEMNERHLNSAEICGEFRSIDSVWAWFKVTERSAALESPLLSFIQRLLHSRAQMFTFVCSNRNMQWAKCVSVFFSTWASVLGRWLLSLSPKVFLQLSNHCKGKQKWDALLNKTQKSRWIFLMLWMWAKTDDVSVSVKQKYREANSAYGSVHEVNLIRVCYLAN